VPGEVDGTSSMPAVVQVSASGIVFANKSVFQHYDYKFTYALTLIHTLTTLIGMRLFAVYGAFTAKPLPARAIAPLAAAYVGYIVLCNLNLKINSVSFYQVLCSCLFFVLDPGTMGRQGSHVNFVGMTSLMTCVSLVRSRRSPLRPPSWASSTFSSGRRRR